MLTSDHQITDEKIAASTSKGAIPWSRLLGDRFTANRNCAALAMIVSGFFGCSQPAPRPTQPEPPSSDVAAADLAAPAMTDSGPDACTSQMAICKDVMIPNELRSMAAQQSQTAFRDFMCGSWFASHQSSVEGEGAVTVLIVSAGGSGSSQSREVTRTEYCADKTLNVTESSQTSLYYRFTTTDARHEWGRCIERVTQTCSASTSSSPVRGHVDAVGESVVVSLRWDRNLAPKQPKFASVAAAVNLKCPSPPRSGTVIPSGASGLTLQCNWATSVAEAGVLSFRTTVGDVVVKAARTVPPRGEVIYVVPVPVENKVEEKPTCGATKNTPELNDVRCGDRGNCECISDGKWCFQGTELEVSAPGAEWRLANVLGVECVRDNRDSCGWNALGAPDRYRVLEQNNQRVRTRVLTNSRSIGIRQCANWARYAMATRDEERGKFQVRDGATFEIEISDGSVGILRGRIDGQDFVLNAGKEDAKLKVLSRARKPTSELVIYRLASNR